MCYAHKKRMTMASKWATRITPEPTGMPPPPPIDFPFDKYVPIGLLPPLKSVIKARIRPPYDGLSPASSWCSESVPLPVSCS